MRSLLPTNPLLLHQASGMKTITTRHFVMVGVLAYRSSAELSRDSFSERSPA